MKPYTLSVLAKQDIAEIRRYLGARSADAAIRLGRRFRLAFDGIAENPNAARLHAEFSELLGEPVRTRKVGRYLILYRSSADVPEIFAVLHGARDLGRVIENRFF